MILDCLHDETQLRMLVGAFAENPGPLSTGASECMRTALQGVNLRLVMVAATQDDEMDYTLLSGVFATVACLNCEDWDICQCWARRLVEKPLVEVMNFRARFTMPGMQAAREL